VWKNILISVFSCRHPRTILKVKIMQSTPTNVPINREAPDFDRRYSIVASFLG